MILQRKLSRIPAEWFCAAAVFAVTLSLFAWTLSPTVTLTDSGELIVVARGLGVAHPPGFPLWVLLAHLASLVPLGNVVSRVNFSSALFAALACAILTLVVALIRYADELVREREGHETLFVTDPRASIVPPPSAPAPATATTPPAPAVVAPVTAVMVADTVAGTAEAAPP